MFHMLIGLGEAMTPFDFRFNRLKIKVTRVTCKKNVHMVSVHYLENCISQTFHISHADGLGEAMTSIDFVFFRSKSQRSHL